MNLGKNHGRNLGKNRGRNLARNVGWESWMEIWAGPLNLTCYPQSDHCALLSKRLEQAIVTFVQGKTFYIRHLFLGNNLGRNLGRKCGRESWMEIWATCSPQSDCRVLYYLNAWNRLLIIFVLGRTFYIRRLFHDHSLRLPNNSLCASVPYHATVTCYEACHLTCC